MTHYANDALRHRAKNLFGAAPASGAPTWEDCQQQLDVLFKQAYAKPGKENAVMRVSFEGEQGDLRIEPVFDEPIIEQRVGVVMGMLLMADPHRKATFVDHYVRFHTLYDLAAAIHRTADILGVALPNRVTETVRAK